MAQAIRLISVKNWPEPEANVQNRTRDPCAGLLSLRSDFVEAIEHFAARPQHYSAQREDQ
jgi:hypothetical protein